MARREKELPRWLQASTAEKEGTLELFPSLFFFPQFHKCGGKVWKNNTLYEVKILPERFIALIERSLKNAPIGPSIVVVVVIIRKHHIADVFKTWSLALSVG